MVPYSIHILSLPVRPLIFSLSIIFCLQELENHNMGVIEMGNVSHCNDKISCSWCLATHNQNQWLHTTLSELEKSTKTMQTLLNLEDGGDTFAQRAEMYYQKIPELVKNVEDYRRWYHLLAEYCSNLSLRTVIQSRSLDVMSLTTTDNNNSSDSSNNSNQLSSMELSRNEVKSEAKRELVAEVERLMEENCGLKNQLREVMFENAALTQAKLESDKESGGDTMVIMKNESDDVDKKAGRLRFWRLKSRKFRSFSC